MTIRKEQPNDYFTVENLTREAFWNVYRPGCMEHYVLHMLRTDPSFVSELDYVIEEEGKIIAHIAYAEGVLRTEQKLAHRDCCCSAQSVFYRSSRAGDTVHN